MASRGHVLRVLSLGIALAAVGCAHWGVSLDLDPGYTASRAIEVEVGGVRNQTGRVFDVDIEEILSGELAGALNRSLKHRDLTAPPRRLVLRAQILEYHPGNAFKRWLLPGWGSATLRVHCDLEDVARQDIVARIDVRRSISGGGLLTVGAAQQVFSVTSMAIAEKIRDSHGIEPNPFESTIKSGPKGRRR